MSELNDIIECIVKFDHKETLKNKGRYFDIIQKDLRKLVKSDLLHNVSNSVCECNDEPDVFMDFYLRKAKCMECGKIVTAN